MDGEIEFLREYAKRGIHHSIKDPDFLDSFLSMLDNSCNNYCRLKEQNDILKQTLKNLYYHTPDPGDLIDPASNDFVIAIYKAREALKSCDS